MVKERSLLWAIVSNFWNSIKPRSPWGVKVGADYNGTEYFEGELRESSRRQRPPRWFIPKDKENFEQELPPEWEAWLRYRRATPPTEEEVNENYKKMMLVKQKAREIKVESPVPKEDYKGFPKYDEFEANPGSSRRFS